MKADSWSSTKRESARKHAGGRPVTHKTFVREAHCWFRMVLHHIVQAWADQDSMYFLVTWCLRRTLRMRKTEEAHQRRKDLIRNC